MFTFSLDQEHIYGIFLNAPSEHDAAGWLALEECLSEAEKTILAAFRFPKRRRDWLLGRYTAKQLLREISPPSLSCPIQGITILNDPQGAPYVLLPNQTKMNGCLSISHTDGAAFCAWTPCPTFSIGADIELIAARPNVFIEDYFTPSEAAQCFLPPDSFRADLVTAIWSAKEAVLKALQQGLKWDTRQVEINLPPALFDQTDEGVWHSAEVTLPQLKEKTWQLWFQRRQAFMLTLACLRDF